VNWVAFSTNAPAWGRSLCAVQVAGRDDLDPWKQPPVSYYAATPDFFKVLGLPLKEGRLFDRHDDASGPPVVVVSDDFAWKYFPTGDAIGKRIKIINGPTPTWREIIGIVPNIKESGPAIATPFQVYEPFAQEPISMLDILIRTNGPVPGISRSLRAAMDTIDPDMPIPEVGSDLNYFLRDTISSQRFALFLFAVFSASALVLSAMGIYGVVSYSVAQRTTEVGVRMALGARPRDILALMFLRTGRIVGIGLAIGLAGSLACTRLLNSLLFEINSHDPVTLVIVVAALGGVAMLACWIPARRAAMLDPMVALRTD
jgi:putative ABC transport system permease protein